MALRHWHKVGVDFFDGGRLAPAAAPLLVVAAALAAAAAQAVEEVQQQGQAKEGAADLRAGAGDVCVNANVRGKEGGREDCTQLLPQRQHASPQGKQHQAPAGHLRVLKLYKLNTRML